MKFTIETAAFSVALSACGKAITKSQIPVIQCIRIEADTGLELRATNFNIEISRRAAAIVSAPGAACVEFGRLSGWVSALATGSQVSAEVDGTVLRFRSGRSSLSLPVIEASTFPSFPQIAAVAEFGMAAADLSALLATGAAAHPDGHTQYYLTGVHLGCLNGRLIGEATDTKLVLRSQIAAPQGAEAIPVAGVIIPTSTARAAKGLFTDSALSILVSAEQLIIRGETTALKSKLIDGSFPELGRLIPTFAPFTAFHSASLLSAVKRVSPGIDGSDKSSSIRVVLSGGELVLSARSDTSEEARDAIEIATIEGGRDFGVNARNVLSALSALDSEEIELSVGELDGSPILLRPTGNPDRMALTMPVRI